MISTSKLCKTYGRGATATHALKGIDLAVRPGEFVAIMGRSGSGKSTLLHLLGLLDKPSSGEIYLSGQNVASFSEKQRAEFRLKRLGYVFQEYSLVPELNLLENVSLPASFLGLQNSRQCRESAFELLSRVGLEQRSQHYPAEASGGEQQRAAIARALVNHPGILFADEPTASLDVASARTILELFRQLNRELEQTIVMVTHEPEDRKYVDRVVWLSDGRVEIDEEQTGLVSSTVLTGN